MKNIIKNNKKNLELVSGFTLIELLGVLILLAVISLITYPIIDKVLSNAKSEAYERQKDSIINAARMYVTTNGNYSTSKKQLSFETLIDAGFLKEGEILDPRDSSKNMPGCVLYNWDESKNQYIFEYSEDCKITYAIGDLLKVQVSASETQNIYVLEVNDNEITGILDRNLGDAVAWVSQEDYNTETGRNYEVDFEEDPSLILQFISSNGPITLNNALTERTKNWSNVSNIKIPSAIDILQFTDFYQKLENKNDWENEYYTRSMEGLKLVKCQSNQECEEKLTASGYSDVLLPKWLTINLLSTGGESNFYAYWTNTQGSSDFGDRSPNSIASWRIDGSFGVLYWYNAIDNQDVVGIRPIITISNSKVLEKLDSPEYVNP